MRKLVLVQFAVMSVVVAMLGLMSFSFLLLDFVSPGDFRSWNLFRRGLELNAVLLLIFGLQHSLMARRGWKRGLIALFPPELERSVYVLMTGFVLFWMSVLWARLSPPLYDLRGTLGGYALLAVWFLGGGIVLVGQRGMGPLDLIGVQTVIDIWRGKRNAALPFRTPFLYRYVRHPLYLGLLLMFWSTPAMTHDHLFFAEVMTAYILVGIYFEERDLVERYGQAYLDYQARVPMLIPFFKRPRRG
ncbi:MAG: isoprenylcysteine carboxylmethyltransferase family protein [Bacteroidota bacterium]